MQRRNFIRLSALTAAAISTPFLNCSHQDTALNRILAIPQILSQLQDQATINSIGKAYGAMKPEEYSLKKLGGKLAEDSGRDRFSSSTPAKEISAALDRNVQDDFESGNTIVVDGWVLSMTEARQCAMFSLMFQKN